MKKRSVLKKAILPVILSFIMLFVIGFAGISKNEIQETNAYTYKNNDCIAKLATDSTALASSYSLADDYPILPENQTSSDLCWIYSSMKALETSIMIQKGEYNNFSEFALAYTGYKRGYLESYNKSGNFNDFVQIAMTYGLTYESEFTNEIFYDINSTNEDNYKYVLNKNSLSFVTDFDAVVLSNDSTYMNKTTVQKQELIKRYIMKYGGLFCGLEEGTIYVNGAYLYSDDKNKYTDGGKYLNGNHAVCLIGWDDRFGFLALNSWGVEEPESYQMFYIPYSYSYFYDTLAGFAMNDSEEKIALASSTASEFSGKIKPNTNKMKNIFCYDETISLKYTFSQKVVFSNVYAKIFKGEEDVTEAFRISYNDTDKFVVVNSANLSGFVGGTYVLKFYEGSDLVSAEMFFVYTGTEVAYFKLNKDSLTAQTDSVLFMNSFVNSDNSDTYYLDSVNDYKLHFYLTGINSWRATQHLRTNEENDNYIVQFEVGNLFVFEDDGENITKTDTGISFAKEYGQLKDWANAYDIKIPALRDYENKHLQFTITLSSTVYAGLSRTYYINIFVSSRSTVTTSSSVPVTYYLDGGKNSEQNPERVANYVLDSAMCRVKLENPTKIGYTFMGWYTSDDYSQEVSYISGALGNNIKLYARWNKETVVYFTTDFNIASVTDYDKNVKEETNELVYGDSIKLKYSFYEQSSLSAFNYNVSYKYFLNDVEKTSDNLGSGDKSLFLDFDFPGLKVGEYKAEIVLTVVIGHNKSVHETKSLTFSVVKKTINLKFSNLNFVYDKQEHSPTAEIDGDGFYKEDITGDLEDMLKNISSPNVYVGTYTHTVAGIKNENYELGTASCSYTISPKQISVVWTDLEKTYNGKSQVPTCSLVGVINGDTASISINNSDMKNVGEYDVSVKEDSLTNKNYELKSDAGAKFKITKAKLTVTFKDIKDKAQTSPEYKKKITYEISGTLFDDEQALGINIICDAINASSGGKYKITGEYSNQNYDITFNDAVYTLTGDYYIFYTLPDGSKYTELVEEGEEPKGINRDIYPLPLFAKFKYSESLNGQTGDLHVDVTIENYTWIVVVSAVVVVFVGVYLFITRKQRKNRVS